VADGCTALSETEMETGLCLIVSYEKIPHRSFLLFVLILHRKSRVWVYFSLPTFPVELSMNIVFI
jgi:hypothetical protein